MVGVVGSSPIAPTKYLKFEGYLVRVVANASVAGMVEKQPQSVATRASTPHETPQYQADSCVACHGLALPA